MKDIPLGKKIPAPKRYDPKILYPITRGPGHESMSGFDLWRCYELSWLNPKGKPIVVVLEVIYPVQSVCIIESKSLKLYLSSLADTVFDSPEKLTATIRHDLERTLQAPWVQISLFDKDQYGSIPWQLSPKGRCIDDLDIAIPAQTRQHTPVKNNGDLSEEILFSHVLRTFCPITHQPDWGSVIVDYTGPKIDENWLLAYICSYRNHEGFAEQCCEQIFRDLLEKCSPTRLCLSCFYTRRGGIDINAVRSTHQISPKDIKRIKLFRQ